MVHLCARVMEGERHNGLLPRRGTKKENKDRHEQNTCVKHETSESKKQYEHHTCYAHDHARKKKIATAHGAHKSMETS